MDRARQLKEMYDRLYQFYGPQNWWPAESRFEMLVGAVLTQNTNWQNVNKAILNLRTEGLLSFEALNSLPVESLALLIKSSGYYNLKARRLKNLLRMVGEEYGGRLDDLLRSDTDSARESLLSVKGIGPETADSILLYAGGHPLFVVDTYTHRIFSRHNLVPDDCDYQTLQELFMDNLLHDPQLFNEYHALIVITAKQFCKKSRPLCEKCPLFEG
jgi:endonuclease-3 related protein